MGMGPAVLLPASTWAVRTFSESRNSLADIARRNKSRGDLMLSYGLVASAQNPLSVSTRCAFVKPDAMSVSGNPSFGCPE